MPPSPVQTEPPPPLAGNRYSEQVAAHRRLAAAAREAEADQQVRAGAGAASFASLQSGRPASSTGEQAVRLLAAAAARKLGRWQDPATGDFDSSDRETLLRQAADMNLPPEVAASVLATVADAFRNRPAPPAAPAADAESAARSRRRWVPRASALLLAAIALILLGVQFAAVAAWLKLLD